MHASEKPDPSDSSTGDSKTAVISELTNLTIGANQSEGWDDVSHYGVSFFSYGGNCVCENKIPTHDFCQSGKLNVDYSHILEQSEGGAVNQEWVLLDNQSTVDVFSNPRYLKNIQEIPVHLKIVSTGGKTTTNYIGFLPGYDWVWFHPNGVANILSLSRVKKKFCIPFDSGTDNVFYVHLSDAKKRGFHESPKGLYFSNLREDAKIFVNTVAFNKSNLSSTDYTRAVDARKLQNIIGAPTYSQYRDIIKKKKLRNCPILETDVVAAESTFGKKLQILKGRTTRQRSMHLRSYITKIPIQILTRYKEVLLTGDIFYINGLRFLATKSRHIKFTTVQYLNTAKKEELFNAILVVKKLYRRRGLNVNSILMDGQFSPIRHDLLSAQIPCRTVFGRRTRR